MKKNINLAIENIIQRNFLWMVREFHWTPQWKMYTNNTVAKSEIILHSIHNFEDRDNNRKEKKLRKAKFFNNFGFVFFTLE